MARRVYIAPGTFKVSKIGYDAAVAAEDNLLLDLSMNTSQIVAQNTVTSTPENVTISGFGATPFVVIYRFAPGGIYSHASGPTDAFMRPFPDAKRQVYNAAVTVSPTSLYFSDGNGWPIKYLLFKDGDIV